MGANEVTARDKLSGLEDSGELFAIEVDNDDVYSVFQGRSQAATREGRISREVQKTRGF